MPGSDDKSHSTVIFVIFFLSSSHCVRFKVLKHLYNMIFKFTPKQNFENTITKKEKKKKKKRKKTPLFRIAI